MQQLDNLSNKTNKPITSEQTHKKQAQEQSSEQKSTKMKKTENFGLIGNSNRLLAQLGMP